MAVTLDFNIPANREKALADLKSLCDHPGWLLLTFIVEGNIEYIKKQVVDGVKDEKIEDVNRLRDKIKVNRDVLNIPQVMIKKLTPLDPTKQINLDPYV